MRRRAGKTERPGCRDGLQQPIATRAAHAAIAVLLLALGACAGRLPAPVDSRVDEAVPKETVAKEAVAESPTPAPGITATLPDPPKAPTAQSSTSLVPAQAGISSPETLDTAEDSVGETRIAPKRLAALSPAIAELLNDANQHSAAGRHDGAAAALERALQIEPADAALWHRLARTRLDQGKTGLAEALAAKSNSLAADDPNLRAQNWRLIAKIRRQLGDASGADDASSRAARLAQ